MIPHTDLLFQTISLAALIYHKKLEGANLFLVVWRSWDDSDKVKSRTSTCSPVI